MKPDIDLELLTPSWREQERQKAFENRLRWLFLALYVAGLISLGIVLGYMLTR